MIGRARPGRSGKGGGLLRTVAAAVAIVCAGCAPRGEADDRAVPDASANVDATSEDAAIDPATLVGDRDGLQMHVWRVPLSSPALDVAIGDLGTNALPEGRRRTRLEANGLYFYRVPLPDLIGVAAPIDDNLQAGGVWHGQVPAWRDLQQQRIAGAPRALAVDGHVRMVGPGFMTLLGRSWSIMTVDGGEVFLELTSTFHEPGPDHLPITGVSPRTEHERFAGVDLEAFMEPGYAYLLTSVPCGAGDAGGAGSGGARGPADPLGHPGLAPCTIGQLLLEYPGVQPPMRDVLLFVPMVRTALRPPFAAATTGRTGP